MGSPPIEMQFVMSASAADQLPDTTAEIAVVGRSNVGKSSLLNALSRRKGLAHTSKTPGRTQLLNCFSVGDATVIDCPGYGFASVSRNVRDSWGPMIERYLLEREQLEMILVLVDGEIGPTKLDQQMLEWVRANDLPHTVVATKHDKVKSSKRDRRKKDLAEGCGIAPGDVVWVSASKDVGIDRLRNMVRNWLDGNARRDR